jgi:hypothetical protein
MIVLNPTRTPRIGLRAGLACAASGLDGDADAEEEECEEEEAEGEEEEIIGPCSYLGTSPNRITSAIDTSPAPTTRHRNDSSGVKAS